jgi:hypothetical protein
MERSEGTGEVENSSESMCFPAPRIEKCGRLLQRLMVVHAANKRETTSNGKRAGVAEAAAAA